jgi:hypothetical protein
MYVNNCQILKSKITFAGYNAAKLDKGTPTNFSKII